MKFETRMPAPFGVLGILVEDGCLARIEFLKPGTSLLPPSDPVSEALCRQIEAYFSDPEFEFDIPLMLRGTPFQKKVWAQISQIPRGETRQYGEIARDLCSAPRAVGQACGSNPVPIVIPCHRVVSRAGLGGFMHHGEGEPLSIKRWLINHESD